MSHDQIPAELIKKLREDSVVLFAGSGLSATAGLPLWDALGKSLIQEALKAGTIDSSRAAELSALSPQTVGDDLLGRLTKNERADFFRRHFWSEAQSDAHRLISRLGVRRAVTTNWDCMLERALEHVLAAHDPKRPWQNVRTGSFTSEKTDYPLVDAARKNLLTSWVFHLHGVYYRPSSIVWETSKYADVLEDEFTSAFFSEMLRDQTVLYVGYSLEDQDFQLITDRLRRRHEESVVRHYAILPNVGQVRRDDLQKKGVTVISYEAKAGVKSAHSIGLTATLGSIAEKVSRTKARPNWRTSRVDGSIRDRINRLLTAQSSGEETDGIKIYASAGRDFLRDHFDQLVEVILAGASLQFLLFDPRTTVQIPGHSQKSIHDWRADTGALAHAYSSSEYAEFREAHTLLSQLTERVRASGGSAAAIETRYTTSFPRNTLCYIGDSLFDCPRPVRQLSIQGPAVEYFAGSVEHAFFESTFESLWWEAAELAPTDFPPPSK
ncbi:SIR2 family protein [Arthrobacter sp. Cr_A7]|uniref:SIR2 family protein n=1 Tax=Arthrobacter sp. Cr_A7 TaxID=3031017 RepID=UPI0023D989AA|nr:SIR2 family protein [Arthrobacter sp. Cr_A7]MDF2051175.1 SIR2 family protein [Arthrobacter sp. Cr_A7]